MPYFSFFVAQSPTFYYYFLSIFFFPRKIRLMFLKGLPSAYCSNLPNNKSMYVYSFYIVDRHRKRKPDLYPSRYFLCQIFPSFSHEFCIYREYNFIFINVACREKSIAQKQYLFCRILARDVIALICVIQTSYLLIFNTCIIYLFSQSSCCLYWWILHYFQYVLKSNQTAIVKEPTYELRALTHYYLLSLTLKYVCIYLVNLGYFFITLILFCLYILRFYIVSKLLQRVVVSCIVCLLVSAQHLMTSNSLWSIFRALLFPGKKEKENNIVW